MLNVQDLHAYYGKSHILQGVNFNVGKGEIVSPAGTQTGSVGLPHARR